MDFIREPHGDPLEAESESWELGWVADESPRGFDCAGATLLALRIDSTTFMNFVLRFYYAFTAFRVHGPSTM